MFICNYKKHFEIKYVIYETYNIIFKILKFYTKYLNYLNVIFLSNLLWVVNFNFLFNPLNVI